MDPKVYHQSVGEKDGGAAVRGDPEFIMSRSSLMAVLRCPERWRNGYEPKGSDSKDWGEWMDCRVLDPGRFAKEYAVAPAAYPCEPTKKDPRTEKPWNRNAAYCQEWEDDQTKRGVTPLKAQDMRQIESAFSALMQRGPISDLLAVSERQVFLMAEFSHNKTGLVIPVKALIDLVPARRDARYGECLCDLKTSTSACPARWTRTVYDYGYDAQAALYKDLYQAATGQERVNWLHVVQENFHPYQVADPIPLLSAEFLTLGRNRYMAALNLYAECLASGVWPAYTPTRTRIDVFQVVEPAAWMAAAAMESFPQLVETPEPRFISETPS